MEDSEKYDFSDLNIADIPNNDVTTDSSSTMPTEICKIMYSDEYIDKMRLFNALLQAKEYSMRSYCITRELIEMIPAYYTAWNFRFEIVKYLIKTVGSKKKEVDPEQQQIEFISQELEWLDEFTLNNPKNYQIWSYRQALLSKIHPSPSFQREMPIIQLMLYDDQKNHHVWSYRKWCCTFFQDFSQELDFIGIMMGMDLYNNSVWCHKTFVLKNKQGLSQREIDAEIKYTLNKIESAPHNISSWSFLKYVLELYYNSHDNEESMQGKQETIIKYITKYRELTSYSSEYLAFFYTLFDSAKYKAQIIELYEGLAKKHDPIRSNYWNYKIKQLA